MRVRTWRILKSSRVRGESGDCLCVLTAGNEAGAVVLMGYEDEIVAYASVDEFVSAVRSDPKAVAKKLHLA
jgi:hypothetical protein